MSNRERNRIGQVAPPPPPPHCKSPPTPDTPPTPHYTDRSRTRNSTSPHPPPPPSTGRRATLPARHRTTSQAASEKDSPPRSPPTTPPYPPQLASPLRPLGPNYPTSLPLHSPRGPQAHPQGFPSPAGRTPPTPHSPSAPPPLGRQQSGHELWGGLSQYARASRTSRRSIRRREIKDCRPQQSLQRRITESVGGSQASRSATPPGQVLERVGSTTLSPSVTRRGSSRQWEAGFIARRKAAGRTMHITQNQKTHPHPPKPHDPSNHTRDGWRRRTEQGP